MKSIIAVIGLALSIAILIAPARAAEPSPAAPITLARAELNYRVEIEGVRQGGLVGLESLVLDTQVLIFREGGDPVARKLPGNSTVGDITLIRNVAADNILWAWHQQIAAGGPIDRKTITVTIGNGLGTDIVRYTFTRCFPSRWRLVPLAGGTTGPVAEAITFAAEGVERTVLVP